MRTFALALLGAGVLASIAAGATGAPTVVAKIKVSPNVAPCAAAAGGGYVWVSEYASPHLLKINPKTNKVVARSDIGFGSAGSGSAQAHSGSRTRARTRSAAYRPAPERG